MKDRGSVILWAAIALCLGLAVLWDTIPLADSAERFDNFPRWGDGYNCQNIPVSKIETEVFQDCNLMKLLCKVQDQTFFMTAIDGTRNRNAVHDARMCFVGDGWKITKEKNVKIPGGNAMLLTLTKNDGKRQREVMIWFTDGANRYGSPVRYWASSALRRLSLGYSGNEPVRVIIQPMTDEKLNWDKIIADFYPLWKL